MKTTLSKLTLVALQIAALGAVLLTSNVGHADQYDMATICFVKDVYDAGNRVHVRCTCSYDAPGTSDKIWYFAVPTSDADRANRFTNMGVAALTHDYRLYIRWRSTDYSGANWGCAKSNCRAVRSISILY